MLIGAQSWSFQHLVDGILPKLVQLWDTLQEDKDIMMLVDYNIPRYPIVPKIWEHIVPKERLVPFKSGTVFHGASFHSSCNTPPLHPYLWQRMRDLFQTEHKPFHQRSNIVYFGRGHGNNFNSGRNVNNEEELLEGIEDFINQYNNNNDKKKNNATSLKLIRFDHGLHPNITDLIHFFRDAKVIIGPHGGSFYNMLFMSSGSLVIEFMPHAPSRMMMNPNLIIWQQAVMLDHTYYHLPFKADFSLNMEANVDKVLRILQAELMDGDGIHERG